jgi:hypothetical protein
MGAEREGRSAEVTRHEMVKLRGGLYRVATLGKISGIIPDKSLFYRQAAKDAKVSDLKNQSICLPLAAWR